MRKGGLRAGDALIITRPLGTGILFAAAMRARAKAPWIAAALAGMRRSNRGAARIIVDHAATAMTDISGFGLVGHLGEMLTASGAEATIDLSALPLYDGALLLARDGIASTLLPENLALGTLLRNEIDAGTRAVLFDPQTAGGLLAGVPAAHAAACIADLAAAGHRSAAVIGRVGQVGLSTPEVGIATRGSLAG